MTREESTKIVDKIQVHRQSFMITNAVYNEWFKVLEAYDFEDVDKKLDDFFKSSENFGRYPDVYYLTKYLKRIDEKLQIGINYVRCQLCGDLVDLKEHNQHYDRCSSIEYLINKSSKYFDKKLNRNKLMSASKEEFTKYYWNFCEKLLDILPNGLEKHVLKNAILTHYGQDAELDMSDFSKKTKEMINNG